MFAVNNHSSSLLGAVVHLSKLQTTKVVGKCFAREAKKHSYTCIDVCVRVGVCMNVCVSTALSVHVQNSIRIVL